jgi:ferredoxin
MSACFLRPISKEVCPLQGTVPLSFGRLERVSRRFLSKLSFFHPLLAARVPPGQQAFGLQPQPHQCKRCARCQCKVPERFLTGASTLQSPNSKASSRAGRDQIPEDDDSEAEEAMKLVRFASNWLSSKIPWQLVCHSTRSPLFYIAVP